jgi:hypothetical protein
MIGPGWTPRPLARVRRGLWSYTPGYLRKQRARRGVAARAASPADRRDAGARDADGHDAISGLEGASIAVVLPTATLLPGRTEPSHRVLVGQLLGWFAARWAWVRPRTVPLIGAVIGMFLVIAVEKHLTELARGGDRAELARGGDRAERPTERPTELQRAGQGRPAAICAPAAGAAPACAGGLPARAPGAATPRAEQPERTPCR